MLPFGAVYFTARDLIDLFFGGIRIMLDKVVLLKKCYFMF